MSREAKDEGKTKTIKDFGFARIYVQKNTGFVFVEKEGTDKKINLNSIERSDKPCWIAKPDLEEKPSSDKEAQKLADQGKVIKIPSSKVSEFVERGKEIKKRTAMDRVKLVCAGKSMSSGITYYRLSERIPYSEFKKVKDLFTKIDPQSDEADAIGSRLSGWMTRSPEKVEERLGIPEERTLEHRRGKRKKREKEEEKKKNEKKKLRKEINSHFEDAETPDPVEEQPEEAKRFKDGFEKMKVDGEILYDSFNIYGGGERFVATDEYVWHIENNGHDGDNWALNNIQTGGAGAIGKRVERTEDLVDLIREYASMEV